jgi:hypothetical protein
VPRLIGRADRASLRRRLDLAWIVVIDRGLKSWVCRAGKSAGEEDRDETVKPLKEVQPAQVWPGVLIDSSSTRQDFFAGPREGHLARHAPIIFVNGNPVLVEWDELGRPSAAGAAAAVGTSTSKGSRAGFVCTWTTRHGACTGRRPEKSALKPCCDIGTLSALTELK